MKKSFYKNLIIAEIGSVHDGSLGNAYKLIELASDCGADIVKFQMHFAEHETLRQAPSPHYFKSEKRFEYFNRTSFTFDEWCKLKDFAKQKSIDFMCSVFCNQAIDRLNKMKVDYIKIPSGEVSNLPMLVHLKKFNSNIILSTGMSNFKEIDDAVKILKNKRLSILQCSSIYPCPDELSGINVIPILKKKYNLPVGFSDHTLGFNASIGAIYMGATIIEKHLTFSKKMYGSDAPFAMEPDDFKDFVYNLRQSWKIKSSVVNKDDTSNYKQMKKVFEKSIVSSRSLKKGHKICFKDMNFKKPGDGIPASEYKKVIGKKLKKDVLSDYKFKIKDLN